MPRFFAPITEEELEAKIQPILDEGRYDFMSKFKSDIKVQVDAENFAEGPKDFGPKKLMGVQTLPNGLTFHGFCSGGDWEQPVFFIVYFDGKKLRAYVPTDGNPWNRTTKEAYGNDEEADMADARKHHPELFEGDKEDWPESFEDIDCGFVEEKIIADITNRIQPVGSK